MGRFGGRPERWTAWPLAALGVAAVAVSACAPRPGPDSAGRDTLRLAVRADVTGFFPSPGVNEAFTVQINSSIFETLVRVDGHLRLWPALAVRWENPDDRTYVFELREGARFSDGRPVTAYDAVASIDANRRGWVTRDYLQAVESVRALDRRRLEIRTRVPYLALLTRLPWAFILPADGVTPRVGSPRPPPPPGSGPYRLDQWAPDRAIRLSRNPLWPGPRPAFEKVRLDVLPDAAERVARVERGEAELADQVPLSEIPRLERTPGVRLVVRSGLRVLFLALRVDRPPFSDPRVREAIDLILDRAELSRRALDSRAELASQLVPASIVGFDPGLELPQVNLARARKLLAEAGYGSGLTLRVDGPNNRYVNDREILAELVRQLNQAGVRATAKSMDKREFFPLVESGRSLAHLIGFACESGDAGDVLASMLHSQTGGPLGSLNSLGMSDPTLDRLITEADAARANDDRASRLRAALRRAAELRGALPLVIQTEAVLISERILWDPPFNLALRPEEMRPR